MYWFVSGSDGGNTLSFMPQISDSHGPYTSEPDNIRVIPLTIPRVPLSPNTKIRNG